MRRTEALQGVRIIRFLDIFGRYEASESSQLEAADLLGMGERTFRRWCHRFEEDGKAGLLDRRLGTASSLRGLAETFGKHGLPLSFYTDRGSHYFYTPDAGGKVDKLHLTQVGRALAQLGIEHIAAYSPQARGRSERLFQTLQDRLQKEMKLAGITTPGAANAFLRDVYLPAHNARYAVAAHPIFLATESIAAQRDG